MKYSNYETILEFLPNDIDRNDINEKSLSKSIKKFIQENNISNILLSLSGGVDSMVLAVIIKNLNIDINLYCCHINYNNREESVDEKNFLIDWCQLENIYLDVMNIDHIKRGEGNRNDYEEETRELRYKYYTDLIKKFDCEGVFLAHHKDDLSENVFNNIMRGKKSITDLSVLKQINTILDVVVFRPMLEFRKKIIYDMSEKYQIPYFLDTTPDWSCRGKMRRQIFPKCEDCYSDSFMKSLVKIGKESDELGDITEKYLVNPILESVIYGKFGFIIPKSDILKEQLIFTNVLRTILNKLEIRLIKQKSLLNLLTNYNNTTNLFSVVKEYFTFVDKDNIIFINKNIINLTNITITNKNVSNDQVLQRLIHGKLIFRYKNKKFTPIYSYTSFNKYFRRFLDDNKKELLSNVRDNNEICLSNLSE
jgi:tRNA(Ile)-lysidine synthetase-like protein